jgi:hypothetical protein
MVNTGKNNHDAENFQKYISVIEAFIDGKLTAVEFEKEFLELHRNDNHSYAEDAHKVISIMFSDVDSFCSIPEIRDENDIDEQELLNRARKALDDLNEIKRRHQGEEKI